VETPRTDNISGQQSNPVFMGRMLDYFGNPGYQLGDSLISSYYYHYQPVYYHEEIIYGDDWAEVANSKAQLGWCIV
jgi:hypothetical protein